MFSPSIRSTGRWGCGEYALYRYVEMRKKIPNTEYTEYILEVLFVTHKEPVIHSSSLQTFHCLLISPLFPLLFFHRRADMAEKVCARAWRNAKILKREINFSSEKEFRRRENGK